MMRRKWESLKCLGLPVVMSRSKGSFDCVRLATHSAQDDKQ